MMSPPVEMISVDRLKHHMGTVAAQPANTPRPGQPLTIKNGAALQSSLLVPEARRRLCCDHHLEAAKQAEEIRMMFCVRNPLIIEPEI
jgi:hypothetical protein